MPPVARTLSPDRSAGLDVFRGLSIAGMILVSNPGGGVSYGALEHSAWNGFTPTDLIFPSFVFIVGVALAFSLASRRTRTEWRGLSLFDWVVPILLVIKYVQKVSVQTGGFHKAPDPPFGGYDIFFIVLAVLLILLPQLERRATMRGGSPSLHVIHHGVLLFALGFIWEFNAMDPGGFRLFAVLQRLGIVYLAGGLIVLHTSRRGQVVAAALLLALYWIVMKVAPVPGFGAGVLTMEGNFAGYVDRLIVGSAHMYQPRPQPYWDPEGLLGAIPATATVLLGTLAGVWLREAQPIGRRISWLILAGMALALAGLGIAPWFPINKNLWSPSFVLFAGGLDAILLGLCVWVVDSQGVKKILHPFIALGANAILLYLISGTLMHYLGEIPAGTVHGSPASLKDAAYQLGFASWLNPYNASLGMALANTAVWMGVAVLLYRKRIFVKI